MKRIFFYILAGALALTSCDDGRIPEDDYIPNEKGRVAKLDVQLENNQSWPTGYTVSIAGFSEDSPYAEITKSISTDANGHASVILSGIPDEVKTLEVCVVNSIRRRVVTFYGMDAPSTTDTIRINPTPINVGMYASIQSQIFDKQCAHCHSGSAWSASLNLNEGKSYASMRNVASVLVEGKERVTPGDASSSVLYEALATDVSAGWKHDHSKIMVTDAVGLQMIRDWINSGAKE